MFRLASLNLNGIRSAHTKGLAEWAAGIRADCICVQELKAQMGDIEGRFEALAGLAGRFQCATQKGYSGVGIYTRAEPSAVIRGLGAPEFDAEGRWVEARFDTPARRLSLVSCYFPSGTSGEERQAAKYRFLDLIYPHLVALKREREFILAGDVNIAHQAIDLKNWRGNRAHSGFLPEERAWLTKLFAEGGLVDVYRRLQPQATAAAYTWWSNRGQAWAKNVGWRIDYQIATPALAASARAVAIYKAQRFSDHAPLIIDYDFSL